MKIVEAGRSAAETIERFASHDAAAAAVALGSGEGAAHVCVVYVDPGGEIGSHEPGLDQLFIVVAGSGRGTRPGGARVAIATGQAA